METGNQHDDLKQNDRDDQINRHGIGLGPHALDVLRSQGTTLRRGKLGHASGLRRKGIRDPLRTSKNGAIGMPTQVLRMGAAPVVFLGRSLPPLAGAFDRRGSRVIFNRYKPTKSPHVLINLANRLSRRTPQ